MGENGSVEELLVQDHAKVVGNGAQVVVGDGLPDDAAAHGEHLDVDFCALFDGVGQTKGDVKVRVGSEQAVLCPDGSLNLLFYTLRGAGLIEQGESHVVLSTVDSMVTTGLALHEMLALCAQSILAEAETTSARQVILQAAETLRKNYQQELCLADLLAEAHMSKSYFLRLFWRYMGTTPYNYLVNFRITQAKELLVLTDHSVGEIAQKVGFGDASNFSTRFAKATGQSPLQYRKSALKPQEGTR